MIGSSEVGSQTTRQIQHELRDINRRVEYLERQAVGAEDRVEAIKRHQLNYALRPNYGGGKVGHGAKTLTGLAVMQKMRRNEERNVEDLHQRRSNLEGLALHKEEQLEQQKRREREEAEERREREEESRSEEREHAQGRGHGASQHDAQRAREREVRGRMEQRSTGSPKPYAHHDPQSRQSRKRSRTGGQDQARERDTEDGRDFI